MQGEIETTYRQMFMGNPVPMMILDTETLEFLAVNDAAVDHYGYSREEFLTLSALDIRPPGEVEAAAKRIHARKPGLDKIGVWKHRKKDGTVIDVEITGHDMAFDGLPARLVMCSDVTENLMAQERIRESEEQFRTTFHMSPDIMTITRVSDGVYLDVNDAFVRIIGFNRDEVISRSSLDLLIWAHPEKRMELIDLLQETGIIENMEAQFRKKDGTIFTGLTSWQVITLENEPHILGIVKDITELKEAEDRLKESEERFRTTFHLSPDIMTISRSSDGVYVDVNEAFVRIGGYNRDEIIGRSSLDLDIWDHPERRMELIELLQDTGTIENIEFPFRKKDGTIFPGLTSCQLITLENEPHILTIVKDISERKVMEEHINRSLGEKKMLLKEIHHRVKNNLQAVAGLLNLQAELIKDEGTLTSFKENEARILSMALIHEKLCQVEDSSRINMGDYVRTLVDRLAHFHYISPDKVKVRVRAPKITLNLDTIVPVGLIINELVSNALKYAFPDGREGEIRVSLSRRKDGTLSLRVSDNGIGLPDEVDIGRSRSLGMLLVKSFVDGLSGTIKVDRKSGTGITITFREYIEHGMEFTS